MKNQTCCFTGHRDIPESKYPKVQKRLEEEITNLINQGIHTFCAGGALGFDMMAELTILSLKKTYRQIKLILVLPCKEQTRGWPEKDKKIYDSILREADEIVYTSEHYYDGCMHERNRRLVDNSGVCVCYLTKNSGGTAYTVDYARRNGLNIINTAE